MVAIVSVSGHFGIYCCLEFMDPLYPMVPLKTNLLKGKHS